MGRDNAFFTISSRRPIYKKFTTLITKEAVWFVAHCVELGVVSQGKTIEESKANLKEAVELFSESFDQNNLSQ